MPDKTVIPKDNLVFLNGFFMSFSSHNLDRESVKNLQLVGETLLFT